MTVLFDEVKYKQLTFYGELGYYTNNYILRGAGEAYRFRKLISGFSNKFMVISKIHL
jgi:hypothetical protein